MEAKYRIDALREAALSYLYAKADYIEFSRRTSWKNRGDDLTHECLYRDYGAAYRKLCDMCHLVRADVETVLSVEKSIRRNSQYQLKWEAEAHIHHQTRFYDWEEILPGSDGSYRRFVTEPDPESDYWMSTGRRKPWAC